MQANGENRTADRALCLATAVLPRGELLGALRREQLIPLGKSRNALEREYHLSWVGLKTGVLFQAEAPSLSIGCGEG